MGGKKNTPSNKKGSKALGYIVKGMVEFFIDWTRMSQAHCGPR